MSIEIFPRWQRGIMASFINMVASGEDEPWCCPSCLRAVPSVKLDSELAWDRVLSCSHCGYAASPLAFTHDEPDAEIQIRDAAAAGLPRNSSIEVENAGAVRTWRIPPKATRPAHPMVAKLMLVFGLCLMLTLSLGADLVAQFHWSDVFCIALIGVIFFWPLGSQACATHVLCVDGPTLRHERIVSDEPDVTIWPREAIHSVSIGVLYTENGSPVYEVEVRGAYGTLRFGADLDSQERAWLCHELRTALKLGAASSRARAVRSDRAGTEPTPALPEKPASSPQGLTIVQDNDKLVLSSHARPHGIVLVVVGLIACVGIGYLVGSGFIFGHTQWGRITSLFGGLRLVCAFITGLGLSFFFFVGLSLILLGWRLRRIRQRIEVSPQGLQVITTCGRTRLEQSWDAKKVRTVIMTAAAPGKNTSFRRGEIVLPDRVVGFGLNCEHRVLQKSVDLLREALCCPQSSAHQPGS